MSCAQVKFSIDHRRSCDRVQQAAFENIVTWHNHNKFSKLLDEEQVAKISELFSARVPHTAHRRAGNRSAKK